MRSLIALLLLFVLPLQAWASSAMLVRMDAGALHTAAGADRGMTAAMPADCPMLQLAAPTDQTRSPAVQAAAAGLAPADAGATAPAAPDSHCLSCQLCMPLIAVTPLTLTPARIATGLPRSILVQPFRTVCLPGALEPPISA